MGVRDTLHDWRLSRRTFLKATGALGVAVTLAGGEKQLLGRTTDLAALAAEADVQTITSVCGACHNGCSISAVVQNGRLLRVSGLKDDPRVSGRLCAKGLLAPQRAYDPRRVRYPLRRTGERGSGQWKRVSWDEALTELADKMKAAKEANGPYSVAFCRGQGGKWGFPYDFLQRLTHAFGTECSMGGSECFIPRVVGEVTTYADMLATGDYANADLIILWGKQNTFSCAPQTKLIFDARERGAKLVVVDPLRFHMGARADQFYQIEPGTDMAMMLAMLYVIVEKDLWDHDFVDKYTNDPGLTALAAHLRGENPLGVAFTPEMGVCDLRDRRERDSRVRRAVRHHQARLSAQRPWDRRPDQRQSDGPHDGHPAAGHRPLRPHRQRLVSDAQPAEESGLLLRGPGGARV